MSTAIKLILYRLLYMEKYRSMNMLYRNERKTYFLNIPSHGNMANQLLNAAEQYNWVNPRQSKSGTTPTRSAVRTSSSSPTWTLSVNSYIGLLHTAIQFCGGITRLNNGSMIMNLIKRIIFRLRADYTT